MNLRGITRYGMTFRSARVMGHIKEAQLGGTTKRHNYEAQLGGTTWRIMKSVLFDLEHRT